MEHRILIGLFLLAPLMSKGQTDSLPTREQNIAVGRQQLLQAFWQNDRETARSWLDFLQLQENELYFATQWDERWLLYFWLEEYPALFREAARFSNAWEQQNLYKIPPPDDSLFVRLDGALYTDQEQIFARIREASLPPEDQEFAGLLLEYLLRLNTQEPEASAYDARLNDFLTRYPKTRFSRLIKKRMYNVPPPAEWALGIDALFLQGNWTDMLERNLRTAYGAEFALGYWRNRWNVYLRIPLGFQKLAQPIEANGFVWDKDESSTYIGVALEAGYDVINQPRLRMLPTVGFGFGGLQPPDGSEDNPNPDYFENFKFKTGTITAALQADVKFSLGQRNVPTSYHGLRVRVGYSWLNFDKRTPDVQGNMFFFAIGYTIFSRQSYGQ